MTGETPSGLKVGGLVVGGRDQVTGIGREIHELYLLYIGSGDVCRFADEGNIHDGGLVDSDGQIGVQAGLWINFKHASKDAQGGMSADGFAGY